jgi:para-nitrobenzyl esterase
MRAALCITLLVLSLTMVVAGPLVDTVSGPVEGYTDGSVDIFRGIPFAAPPVGENRLRPPQPVTPWKDVRSCVLQAQICSQVRIADWLFLGGEDCLYLDVYTPVKRNPQQLKPVLVWIYGGGYVFGDGWEFGFYDGTNLVNAHEYVLITFNYRLGPLGFMALDELKSENGDGTTGNYALQDQRAVLQWVQANAAAFGGDPNRVTIAGESAGAFSVCWHMVSPLSKGLFHAAIMESGTCDAPQFFVDYEDAKSWTNAYVTEVGCTPGAPDLIDCLRKLPTGAIMGHLLQPPPHVVDQMRADYNNSNTSNTQLLTVKGRNFKLTGGMLEFFSWAKEQRSRMASTGAFIPPLFPCMSWGPAIDGSETGLVANPLDLIHAGKWNNVPIIAGTNENEGTIFVPMMILVMPGKVTFPLSADQLPLVFNHFFNNQTIVDAIQIQYPLYQYNSPDDLAADVLRDYFFVCSARRALRIINAQSIPTWLYHFTYVGDWIEDPFLGEYHSSELEFVFDNAWPPIIHSFSAKDQQMANDFGSYWANMVFQHNPNGDGSIPVTEYWPQYNSTAMTNVILAQPLSMEADLFEGQCQFWDRIVGRNVLPVHQSTRSRVQ